MYTRGVCNLVFYVTYFGVYYVDGNWNFSSVKTGIISKWKTFLTWLVNFVFYKKKNIFMVNASAIVVLSLDLVGLIIFFLTEKNYNKKSVKLENDKVIFCLY